VFDSRHVSNPRSRRLFEAQRAGVAARLADLGVPSRHVERLMVAWEERARRRGFTPLTRGYWEHASEWMLSRWEDFSRRA
jgi:hypothetical protein